MARLKRKSEPQDPLEAAKRVHETALRTDSDPRLVEAARFIRRLLPGDAPVDDESGRPSAIRELGSGVLETWQTLSEAQQRKAGEIDVTILFTDLVGFSSWALEAGDEPALELLRQVGAAEQDAISGNGGTVVKRLGDGAMAVFSEPDQAVLAALGAQRKLTKVEVEGHSPKLRAGVHVGRPRRVRRDFLGVDVNIAARVGEMAKGDEVLVSGPTRDALDSSAFRFGPARELSAPGAPSDLTVCSVKSKRRAAAR